LIALCVRQHVFEPEREEEEIRALWKTAHQRVLLDEAWLSDLLARPSAPPAPVEEAGTAAVVWDPPTSPISLAQAPQPGHSSLPDGSRVPPAGGPRVDWGEALDVPSLYGREQELSTLAHWVVQEHCRLVSVLGLGGIGKSALAVRLMHQVAAHFEVVL
jgi:hypothetical protein